MDNTMLEPDLKFKVMALVSFQNLNHCIWVETLLTKISLYPQGPL